MDIYKKADALAQKVSVMETALRWYADYGRQHEFDESGQETAYCMDAGSHARNALAQIEIIDLESGVI